MVAAVDLAKLWVLAERCLMPQLQNQVIDKLGDPLTLILGFKNLKKNLIIATQELVEYVDHTAGDETPLKRYCVQLLLFMFSLEKEVRGSIGIVSLHQRAARICMEQILGKGLATDVIKSLMTSFGHLDLVLPTWNAKDYYVNGSN